jgi:WD repeat-containing protein 23
MEFGEIEVEIEEENNQGEAEADNAERSEPYMFTLVQILVLISRFAVARTRRRVLRLLQNSEIGRIFRFAPDDDDDDGDWNPRWSRRQRTRPDPNRFPKVPSDKGIELMNSGLFGSNPAQAITSRDKISLGSKKKLALRIMERELAVGSFATEKLNNRLLAQVRPSVLFL